MFWLYLALSQSSSIAARRGDMSAAEASLQEMRAIEDADWPPHKLTIGASAECMFAFVLGKPDTALRQSRKQVSLRRAAGISVHLSTCNLIGAEVAAGEAEAAVAIGQALMAQLHGTRDEHTMAYARLNMVTAWLALDNTVEARALVKAGLPSARRFDHLVYWADFLTLLTALEGRYPSAALFSGYADERYVRTGSVRMGNEVRLFERGCKMARLALGESRFERLRAEGALLLEDDIMRLAFDQDDASTLAER